MVGEYSIRGGILDVFGAESARPLRIEFFGDEIESIRRFDVETQRSVMKISEAQVLPLAEQPRSRQLLHASRRSWIIKASRAPAIPFPAGNSPPLWLSLASIRCSIWRPTLP